MGARFAVGSVLKPVGVAGQRGRVPDGQGLREGGEWPQAWDVPRPGLVQGLTSPRALLGRMFLDPWGPGPAHRTPLPQSELKCAFRLLDRVEMVVIKRKF